MIGYLFIGLVIGFILGVVCLAILGMNKMKED